MARRQWTKEEKKQVILAALKNEESIAELCRRHGIHDVQYYKWRKQEAHWVYKWMFLL